jgi:hypothetical protein
MDLHLQPGTDEHKTHYLIEVKSYHHDMERISEEALGSLRQIYDLNYFKPLMQSNETTPVIVMGLAAHYDHVCLVTQKVHVSKGKITGAETITHQRFWIAGNSEDELKVKHTDPVEHKLDLSHHDIDSQPETADKEHGEQRKRAIHESISEEIKEVIRKYRESTEERAKQLK